MVAGEGGAEKPPELPGAALRPRGSSEEESPREEDDPDRPPKAKTNEEKIYDKIDHHVERIEQHDAILAQAQKELEGEQFDPKLEVTPTPLSAERERCTRALTLAAWALGASL